MEPIGGCAAVIRDLVDPAANDADAPAAFEALDCRRLQIGEDAVREMGGVLIWKPNLDSRFKYFLKFRRPFLTLGYHVFLNPLEDGLMFFARLCFNPHNERLFFFVHLVFRRAAIATFTADCADDPFAKCASFL